MLECAGDFHNIWFANRIYQDNLSNKGSIIPIEQQCMSLHYWSQLSWLCIPCGERLPSGSIFSERLLPQKLLSYQSLTYRPENKNKRSMSTISLLWNCLNQVCKRQQKQQQANKTKHIYTIWRNLQWSNLHIKFVINKPGRDWWSVPYTKQSF